MNDLLCGWIPQVHIVIVIVMQYLYRRMSFHYKGTKSILYWGYGNSFETALKLFKDKFICLRVFKFYFFNLCLIFARLCFWTRKNFLLFGSIKLTFIHSHYVCEKMTGAFIWFVKFIMQCHFCYWLWEKHEKFKECDEQGNKRYLLRLHIILYFRLVWVSSVHYWLMLSLNEFLLCYIILLSSFGMFLSFCFWCLINWMH